MGFWYRLKVRLQHLEKVQIQLPLKVAACTEARIREMVFQQCDAAFAEGHHFAKLMNMEVFGLYKLYQLKKNPLLVHLFILFVKLLLLH